MITGTQNPVVGKDEVYQFNDNLDVFNSSNATYVWNIWKKKSGSWINITKKPPKMGKSVPFKFGEKVTGEEFKLQVFRATKRFASEEYESKSVGEFFLVPTSSKVPKIDKVILFNQGAKDPNKASYHDTLTARAYCIAMFNEEVEFQLWEDDAAGKGHDPAINKNNQLPQIFKSIVNKNGIAEVKISLLSNSSVLKAIANKYMMKGDQTEGADHEYYVTASYGGKIRKASQVNVDVSNPDHKTKPKENSAIFPGTSRKPQKPDAESKITNAYFVDSKGNPTQKIKVGANVCIRVKSNNMLGEYIKYTIWEYDRLNSDKIFQSSALKIIDDSCTTPLFQITQKKFDDGIDLNFPYSTDPDKDSQEYYIEITPLGSKAKSVSFGLDDEAKRMKVENGKSPAVVKEQKVEKEDNKGNCIPCQIGLTVQDLDKFMKATPHGSILNAAPYNTRITAYISYLNQYMTEFEINKNCYRRANFLGQVAKETKFWSYREDFAYKSTVLKSKFSNFKTEKGGRYADSWGYDKNKSEVTKEGEIKIANWAYSRGSKATDLGNKICPENDVANPEQDGYKYRGRGLIQLTGRNNYTNFQSWFNDNRTKLKLPNVDFVSNPDLVFESQYIVLSAIYFWTKNGLNEIADAGVSKETVQKISNKINSGEEQAKKDIRYDYVKSAHSVLSEKSQDCPLKTNYKTPSAKWHDPVDNPICTLYMQSGGGDEAGKHWGLFGQTRNGSDHVGLDLFATKGISIYACVDGTIYNRRWHGGYGNTITIKVKNPKEFMKFKKNYMLQFGHKGEIASGGSWSANGDIYLFYGHLDSVKEYEFGQEVKCGEVLGTTGRSGVEKGTCAPHLHFEVLSDYVMGSGSIRTRINPAFFVDYKGFSEQTNAEKKKQEDEKNNGKIVQFEGVKKLGYADIKGFIK